MVESTWLFVSHDCNIVRMALAQTRLGDPYEAATGSELRDICGSGVPHPGTKSARHLADEICDRAGIADPCFDTFGNVLAGCLARAVAVGSATAHRAC